MTSKIILPCGLIKSIWKNKDDYYVFKINGKNILLHRYIFEHHKGKIPAGMTINHIDGNKHNNEISNLEIMTFSENSKHSWKNNLARPCKGELHGRAVLDDIKVLTILTMPKNPKNGIGNGYTNKDLSSIFGVSVVRISNIRNGKEWKHINVAIGN